MSRRKPPGAAANDGGPGTVSVAGPPAAPGAMAGTGIPEGTGGQPAQARRAPPGAKGPPPSEAEVAATLAMLRESFAAYYRDHEVPLPARFGRREFGFLLFDRTFFHRHLGFAAREDLSRYLAEEAPAHAYYSTAFYRDPNRASMAEKGWLGAELIFDLDADHVPGAETLPYPQQLARVKEEFLKLLDEFILGDLGFSEEDLILNFSGGRGYHCHVVSPRVLGLDARARREIVDYVTGKGLEDVSFLRPVTYESKRYEVRGRPVWSEKKTLPKVRPDAPGWEGRVARAVIRTVDEVAALPREEAMARLTALDGVGPKRAEQFLAELTPPRLERIRGGEFDQTDLVRHIIHGAIERQAVALGKGETDEPVTADVKRLIRLPGSLHGKSGLRVTVLRYDDLRAFDPLESCLPEMDGSVTVRPAKDASLRLAGRDWTLGAGKEVTLPRNVAVHVCARRQAVVPSGRQP